MMAHVAPASRCTSTSGPRPRSGRTDWVGLVGLRRSGPDGTSSSSRRQRVSSASSGSASRASVLTEQTLTGMAQRYEGWTSPLGEARLPALRFDTTKGASLHRRWGTVGAPRRCRLYGRVGCSCWSPTLWCGGRGCRPCTPLRGPTNAPVRREIGRSDEQTRRRRPCRALAESGTLPAGLDQVSPAAGARSRDLHL